MNIFPLLSGREVPRRDPGLHDRATVRRLAQTGLRARDPDRQEVHPGDSGKQQFLTLFLARKTRNITLN